MAPKGAGRLRLKRAGKEEGVSGRVGVVGGAATGLGEAVVGIERNGGGIGMADFEEANYCGAGAGLGEGGREELGGDAEAAVGRKDGEVENLEFVGGEAGNEKSTEDSSAEDDEAVE